MEAEVSLDNVMGCYDPYNTGVYKGVKVLPEAHRQVELKNLARGQDIAFKKRKTVATVAGVGTFDSKEGEKIKRIVRKTNDDEDS